MNPKVWNLIFLVGFVLYLGIRGRYARLSRTSEKAVRRVDRTEKALLFFVIGSSLVLPILYLTTPLLSFADYRLPAWVPWAGTVLMVVALWLFWRSHADLGVNWSVTLELRKEHKLVKSGVYRAIRHPMYSSIWLWSIAQGLLLQNWLAGWCSLLSFALLYFTRVSREEQMMIDSFGEEYRQYMKSTGRLFPSSGRGR